MAGRPLGGGAGTVVSAASGTGSFVAIPGHATGFYVVASAPAFIDVRAANTADTLTVANAAPIAASLLYGPFGLMRGGPADKYIAVAGNAGAATVTITFVT